MKVHHCILVVGEDPPLGLQFWCPACDEAHVVRIDAPDSWTWNGSENAPTITPSVKCEVLTPPDEQGKQTLISRCHSTITDGVITFCPDCTHAMASQSAPIPDWPLEQIVSD